MTTELSAEISAEIARRYPFACELAERAAQRAMTFYRKRQKLAVEHKGSDLQDVVSQADRDVEHLIRDTLTTTFPQDGFLGEESGGQSRDSEYLWVVDPIDGTACFLNGLHTWCVSLAVLYRGEPVIGVVCDPNHQELFHACRGHGAFLNQERISVHGAHSVKEGVMGVGTSHRVTPEDFVPFIGHLLGAGGMFIRSGSGALMTAQVAAGRLIGYYEPHMNPWDSLPGLVLVQEAGGITNRYLDDGGLDHGNPVLMSTPALYPQLAEMIVQPLK